MGHSFYLGRGICMTSKSAVADMHFSGLNIFTALCSHPCGIPSLWVSAGLASNQQSSVKVLQYTWLHAPNYVPVLYETTVLIWSLSLFLAVRKQVAVLGNPMWQGSVGGFYELRADSGQQAEKTKQNKLKLSVQAPQGTEHCQQPHRLPSGASRQETQLWSTTW